MEAAMGDLLSWWKKLQYADMLKAYIIKSRVRLAEKLLLVQPSLILHTFSDRAVCL